MMTTDKRILPVGFSIGLLALITAYASLMNPDQTNRVPSRLQLNGLQLNGFTLNGLQLNGKTVNHSAEYHPDWIDPAETQVTLNHQSAEIAGLNGGHLILRLDK
ncbi:MAG: hypothetical protein ACFE0I_05575 [Elainellaceae cyanobacterium]